MSFLKDLKAKLAKALIGPTTLSHCEIDWAFIKQLEGFSLKGYVPKDAEGGVESGVTIASGFDIGQRSKQDLYAISLSLPLLTKMLPYCNLKGQKAKEALKQHPLVLTNQEAEELEKKSREVFMRQIEKEYNDYSDFTFCMLDSAKQTVIMSVGFQYGSLRQRCPTFFKYVTRGMWKNAVAELKDFGDDYDKRRQQEAALLETSIKKI